MGKVDRQRNKVEHFAALFWALGNVYSHNLTLPAAQHHSTALHKVCMLYRLWSELVQFSTKTCCSLGWPLLSFTF